MPFRLLRGSPSSSLYASHVPTGFLGKLLIGADAAARALTDPREARMVGIVGEATGTRALRRMHQRMKASPHGRAVLADRPMLTKETLEQQLHGLPPDSFGGAYATFLSSHGFDPDERTSVQFVDDADLAYVMTRYRQVHDLWHVLYGLPPSLLGEVALKWLEAAQTGLPMAAMAYLYPAVMQIATLEGTGIKTLDDLAGKRISLGPPGSNSAVLCMRILQEKGVFDQGNAQFLSYTEGTKALVDGNVDAACVLAGAPVAALIDLDAKADMVMIPVDEATMTALVEKYPFYQPFEIKAGTYSDQKEPVAVVNDPATLFAKASADTGLIERITATIFTNLEELHAVHPAARRILRETATNVPVDLHAGAKAWYDANP